MKKYIYKILILTFILIGALIIESNAEFSMDKVELSTDGFKYLEMNPLVGGEKTSFPYKSSDIKEAYVQLIAITDEEAESFYSLTQGISNNRRLYNNKIKLYSYEYTFYSTLVDEMESREGVFSQEQIQEALDKAEEAYTNGEETVQSYEISYAEERENVLNNVIYTPDEDSWISVNSDGEMEREFDSFSNHYNLLWIKIILNDNTEKYSFATYYPAHGINYSHFNDEMDQKHKFITLDINQSRNFTRKYIEKVGTGGINTFTSTDPTVATVDNNGVVKGVSNGFTEIILTSEGLLAPEIDACVVFVTTDVHTPLEAVVSYDPATEPGLGPVKAIISTNKPIREIDGWIRYEDRKMIAKDYRINTRETVTVEYDTDDEQEEEECDVEIVIEGIEEPLHVNTHYSNENPTADEEVTVTLTANKYVRVVEGDGWIASNNNKTFTKKFIGGADETVVLQSKWNEDKEIHIKITIPTETDPEQAPEPSEPLPTHDDDEVKEDFSNTSKDDKGQYIVEDTAKRYTSTTTDTTTAWGKLPQTGENSFTVISIIAVVIISLIVGFKNFKNRDIK